MTDLLIKDVPPELEQNLIKLAREAGRSLSDEIMVRLRESLPHSNDKPTPESRCAWEALRSAFVETGAVGDEFAEMMDEIEAERKRDLVRPPPDFE